MAPLECYLTHNGSRLSSIQSIPATRDLHTGQYFQFIETVGKNFHLIHVMQFLM